MTTMELLLYIVAPVILIVSAILILLLLKKNKTDKVEVEEILSLFDKELINKVEYVRNKIVVHFKNVKKFNHIELKEFGANGINIIGDKIKFYFNDDNITKSVFDKLEEHIK